MYMLSLISGAWTFINFMTISSNGSMHTYTSKSNLTRSPPAPLRKSNDKHMYFNVNPPYMTGKKTHQRTNTPTRNTPTSTRTAATTTRTHPRQHGPLESNTRPHQTRKNTPTHQHANTLTRNTPTRTRLASTRTA